DDVGETAGLHQGPAFPPLLRQDGGRAAIRDPRPREDRPRADQVHAPTNFTLSRDGLISMTPEGGPVSQNNGPESRYYGKYRGVVVNNADPEMTGRLLVTVPDVPGPAPSSWAVPCVPLAGPTGQPMGVYLVPPIGAGVWVEFEQGDPERPIWVG